MDNENLEETQGNPVEEDTTETSEEDTEEETSVEEQETSEKPEIAPSEKKGEVRQDVYERMKKAERKAKELEVKLKAKPSTKSSSDPLKLAKTVSALKDYSPEELDDIALISKAKDISLEEAADAEEAKTLIAARRLKVAKDKKTPEPSSAFATPKGIKDIKEMSDEEFEAFDKRETKKQRGKME
ncbi:MAG: hypothetical protein ACTSQE_06790 [Candidatus Heimdallarchaeaceae archaeon]